MKVMNKIQEKNVRIGLVHTVTFEDEKHLNSHGNLIEEHFLGTKVESYCIKGQPKGFFDLEEEKKGIPEILRIVKNLQELDFIIIDCCLDPGLKKARKLTKLPVIGPGLSVTTMALQYGDRLAYLGKNEPTALSGSLRKFVGSRLVGIEWPTAVSTALDLFDQANKKSILEAGERLLRHNPDVIALSCTGYSAIRIAPELSKHLGIPVIDPLIAAVSIGLGILNLTSFFSHS